MCRCPIKSWPTPGTIDELSHILPAIESKKIVLKMMVKAIDKILEGSSISQGNANIVQSVTPKLVEMLDQLIQVQGQHD